MIIANALKGIQKSNTDHSLDIMQWWRLIATPAMQLSHNLTFSNTPAM